MKSLLNLAFAILLSIGSCQSGAGQNRAIDSLKNVLLHQQPDTNKALTYVRLSENYIGVGDTTNIFLYADSALSLARKLSFTRIEASATENRGYGYMATGKFDSAKQDLLTSLDIRKKIGDKRGIAQSSFSIAEYYRTLDSLPEALEYYYRALEVYEGNGDNTFSELRYTPGEIRFTLSQIYLHQGNDSEALINARLASEIAKQTGNYNIAVNALEILGNIEFDQQQYEKALETFQEAIEMVIQTGLEQSNTGEIYIRIGDTYQKQGEIEISKGNPEAGSRKYNQALAMYDSTKKIFRKKNNNASIIPLGIHIAKIDIHLKKYQEARKLLEEFINQPQNMIYKTDLGDAYASLAALDSTEGNYKKAWQDYRIYIRNRDSISNVRSDRRFFGIQMQHEFNVREADAKVLQEKKDEEARENKTRQNFTIIGLTLLILAALVIALIQMRNNKTKQKTNRLLQTALMDLKSTQTQLIQSEKLASLGELTAGIAHEIQNPLNFINNFSEVNAELIEEMQQEMDRENFKDAKAISNEIKNNEEKINHHGQRADAIVKGMLQHSRVSKGQKELVNINAKVDECFRLSYHALRAKDKSFKADLQTDYDESIVMIPLIQQDIVRVFLNVFNNAFYAINEKSKQQISGYEPIVSVNTKMINGKVEIRVMDNGNGIPQKVKDKIFQPFFTTKPTGQGTGLGLSLSYDIVKAHGGEIRVDTKEGAFTEFIVQIPAV